jgi:hypothetical protein
VPEGLFSEPLVDTTVVTVDVNADDDIVSTEYRIGDEVVSSSESYTIEPATTAPGTYTLDVSVTDSTGDVGTLSADFVIAALPPTVLFDFAPEAGDELSETQLITVTAGGQTDITAVEFAIDNVTVATDSEAPYEFSLDPFTLAPAGHILTITATNAGGQSTSVNSAFAVATLPPQIAVTGLTSETVLSDTISANVLAVGQSTITHVAVGTGSEIFAESVDSPTLDFTLNAVDFAPGTTEVDITATDSNGTSTTATISFAVAALPPTIDISGLTADDMLTGDVTVTVTGGGQTEITLIDIAYDGETASTLVGNSFTVPTATLGNGDHDVMITVTNAGGQSADVSIPFVINLPPTPTATPLPTDTVAPSDTAKPTNTVAPTENATETAVAAAQIEEQATIDVIATTNAENTQTAEDATATIVSKLTQNAQSTMDIDLTQAAGNALMTADARATQQMKDLTATFDAIDEATANAEETANAQLTIDANANANETEVAANIEASAEAVTVESDTPTDKPTLVPPTATDLSTEASVGNPTPRATLTPVTIVEVDSQSADQQETSDNSTAVIAIGAGLLLLLLLFIFLRRRGQ